MFEPTEVFKIPIEFVLTVIADAFPSISVFISSNVEFIFPNEFEISKLSDTLPIV